MRKNLMLFALLCAAPALARTVNVSRQDGDLKLSGESLSYLEDREGNLGSEAVRKSAFEKLNGETPNFGFSKSAWWLKFSLINRTRETVKKVLVLDFPLLDSVTFCRPGAEWDAASGSGCHHTGLTMPFRSRDYDHRNFAFDLSLKAGERADYFLRVKGEDSLQMPLLLFSPRDFARHTATENLFFGVYFGLILVMAFYNLFLWTGIREKVYLYYVIYILVFLVFLASQYGYAYQYLWPDADWLARRMNPVLAALLEASVLLFATSFLNLKVVAPNLCRMMRMSLVALLTIAPLALVLNLTVSAVLVVIGGLWVSASIFFATASSLRAGYRPARYFAIAFSVLIFGAVLYALKTFGALPANFITNYAMQIGSALEVTLLSLGLADRISNLTREKEEEQQKRIAEKEASVRQLAQTSDAYARMVPRDLVRLLRRGEITDLKAGDHIEENMTLLFSDLRSFTNLSESMSPAENFRFLNSYLARMNPHIEKAGGLIDKYIGDAIMALFPGGNADGAMQAAISMQKEITLYNRHRRNSGYMPISAGIGIHSGEVMLGTIGDEKRMELTVISDNVNLAARVQDLTRTFGARVLCSATAFSAISDPVQYDFRILGQVKVKGKKQAVSIFEVLNALDDEDRELKLSYNRQFENAVLMLWDRQIKEAMDQFLSLQKINPFDAAVNHYIRECRLLEPGAVRIRKPVLHKL